MRLGLCIGLINKKKGTVCNTEGKMYSPVQHYKITKILVCQKINKSSENEEIQ